MRTPAENPREVVNRFLGKLGEPLSPLQIERAIARVHDRLDEPEALRVSREATPAALPFQWSVVTAVVLMMFIGGAVQLLLLPQTTATIAKAISGEVELVRIDGGQRIRAGTQGGVIGLTDASRIELSPHAELAIVPASDGVRVRLSSGTVIVTAAKQRKGHLYVETKDLLVSVVGTVFSVSAESVGSRVSVIEGEVHVQQGQNVQTLRPGQQASTSPALGPLPVETELKWSKRAPELAAMLQQAVPALSAPAPQAAPQTVSRVLQGTVRSASKQEGIPGVAVTICPRSESRYTRIRTNPGGAEIVDAPAGAGIFRNKTFFFALWDAGISGACASAVQVRTDGSGRFQMTGLTPGEYMVRAELEGYLGPAVNGTYPASDTQELSVDAQQPMPEVSLSLVRAGIISGRVRDAEGKAMVNAVVYAGSSGPAPGTFASKSARSTDDRGEYRLFGLPPGEYYVGVGVEVFHPKADVLNAFRNTALNAALQIPQTFFPNAASMSEAVSVTVREGEEVTGIDIVTRPVTK